MGQAEEGELLMVHVEAVGRLGGLYRLVRGEADWEERLRFADLYAALGEPPEELFWALEEDHFALEVEVEADLAEAWRQAAEEALGALGADWGMAEFDDEDTMSRPKMSRTPAHWD